jgi:hypothetical protein
MTSSDAFSETRRFVKYLSTMQSLTRISLLPKEGESITGFWNDVEEYKKGTKFGVTLGTLIWPLYSTDRLHLHGDIGNGWKHTTKEWLLRPSEVVFDYNEYVLIVSEMMKDVGESELYVLGFFLPKDGLYEADRRHNHIARSGKRIERTVEVASASSKKGKKWEVLVYSDGTKSCNCPSWIFHNTENGGNCKHTLKVK